MDNTIKKYYENAPTEKLLKLLEDLDDIQPEAITILYNELETRNETQALKKLDYYIENGTNENSKGYDIEGLRSEIKDRLSMGESITDIKFDIKERIGNDAFENFLDEFVQQETVDEFQFTNAVFNVMQMDNENKSDEDKINQLKEIGLSEEDSKQIVDKSHNDMNALVNEANQKLRSRAKKDVIIGSIIIVLVIFSIIIQFVLKVSMILVATGFFFFGLFLLLRGFKIYQGLSDD